MKTYNYGGTTIAPCERAPGDHRGRWVIWRRHTATGMLLADELCAHSNTLAEARARVDAMNETRRAYGVAS